MTTNKKYLLLLFERPQEPVFMIKGDKKTVFEIPSDYYPDEYKPLQVAISDRFATDAEERVRVKEISIPSALQEVLELGRNKHFSLFIPKHQKLAGILIEIFLKMESIDDLLSVAVYARDRVNPYLFNYAYSVALLHRDDTKDLDLPRLVHSFPDKFIHSEAFIKARAKAAIVPEGSRTPIDIPMDYTASDLDEEHRLAYFREDLGINLHHWHWHLVYPTGPKEVADKNRRGELFYYMHQQMVARYNFERLANHLKRTKKFSDWTQPIKEGYFPKLDSSVAGNSWPGRVHNEILRDIDRAEDGIKLDVENLKRWRDRIFAAISQGTITDHHNQTIKLTENEGIDILANIVEANVLSKNRHFYGNLHNMGHNFIALVHDPDHRHLENPGVMSDPATSVRDPTFFRWHAFIDDVFQEFKATLPRYSEDRLNFLGITVSKIEVQSEGATKTNIFDTFWQKSEVDLSTGMDFESSGSVFVRFTHLQHQPFTYKITVNNENDGNKMGTCRIFLAPKFDERKHQWSFVEQKNMFIELDKFTVSLKQGTNTITRASDQSSVIIPFDRIFCKGEYLGGGTPLQKFCGCGWPQHMLIPKGTPEGMPCQLFVMISNYENDKIDQSTEGNCNDAASYCGIKDKLYPDRQSMGYPFDRMPRDGVNTLQEFLTPNMHVQDVIIKFNGTAIQKPTQQCK